MDTAGSILFSAEEFDRYAVVVYDTCIEVCLMEGGMLDTELAIREGSQLTAKEIDDYLDYAEYVYVSRISQCSSWNTSEDNIKSLERGLEKVLSLKGYSAKQIQDYLDRCR